MIVCVGTIVSFRGDDLRESELLSDFIYVSPAIIMTGHDAAQSKAHTLDE